MQFSRDLEESIYDDLLDYASSRSTTPTILIALGPAGYEVSTLLMALAAKLAQDRAGPVFMHKPGTQLVEGDVEFAASIFADKRPFFIIDNAADDAITVDDAFRRPQTFTAGWTFPFGRAFERVATT